MGWAFPGRLPLGAGFSGTCCAGAQATEVVPDDNTLRDFCNLGHARGCSRLPEHRRADSVRFAVAQDAGERIVLNYVYDLDHLPVAHGQLEYDCARRRWTSTVTDACLERQAECYLAVYLERRPRPSGGGAQAAAQEASGSKGASY